uniref:Putative homing endonuclease n=1 Tax=viral metagenome TaxID=1070528 RepID=A0A6H1ZH35_9ZZZZ
MNKLLYRNKIWLKKKYISEKLTSQEIADLLNLKSGSTIIKWLKRFDIPRRQIYKERHNELLKNVSKEWLIQKYWKEHLSLTQIARLLGYVNHHHQVSRLFQYYDIPRRPAKPYSGKYSPSWKGGRFTCKKKGYIYLRKNNKYISEHTFVMEKKIGRKLVNGEVVHHRDGNPSNNKLSNLLLLSSNSNHIKYESILGLFAKQLLWGKIKTSNRKFLLKLFNNFIKERN